MGKLLNQHIFITQTVMALLLCLFGWFVLVYHFFPQGQMSWFTDTWFHLMRIRDLNMSLGHMTIPNVVNNQPR